MMMLPRALLVDGTVTVPLDGNDTHLDLQLSRKALQCRGEDALFGLSSGANSVSTRATDDDMTGALGAFRALPALFPTVCFSCPSAPWR